ncbi:DUF596 domain-containing protein [Stenotrophomonas sp. SY1]|uniref:DUF596 domain-containing protein n=1 Tax=Stenotrophomonas sp. SY1 TaxID=477235 RepID=UPI001E376DFC|nr:DUF596 domain-containing protein [Stenotrophomonas sp. SY1]MCD9087692.1 DUF596 domain-containing protein [Stenotrophomonas sp. SY1]
MLEVSEEVFDEIYFNTQGMSFGGVWSYTKYCPGWAVPEAFSGFDGRKDFFFRCLKRFMDSNLLMLHKAGEVIDGSIEDKLNLLNDRFPSSEEGVDMGGDAVWFYTDACPAEPAWILKGEDGVEFIDWA